MSNSKETILLIEDEEALGEGLQFNFEAEGYTVHWYRDGNTAMEFIENSLGEIDIIVLDLMLPGIDGFEILTRTRILAERVPIIILSAKSQESDKVKALELGADDYVTKPFSLTELILRVQGLVKRGKWYRSQPPREKTKFGDAFFSSAKLILEKNNGEIVRLSPMEALLVQTFLDSENLILSRGDLLEKVWNQEKTIQTRTVDVFIGKLRKHIEPDPSAPIYVLSVRGIGYAYVSDLKLRQELLS